MIDNLHSCAVTILKIRFEINKKKGPKSFVARIFQKDDEK